MNYYSTALSKYAVFSGRASRAEFWNFTFISVIVSIFLGIIGLVDAGVTFTLYSLAVLIPGLAVSVRRLHYTNRSAWWLLITILPYVGAIVFLVFMVLAGTTGANRYGEDPKLT